MLFCRHTRTSKPAEPQLNIDGHRNSLISFGENNVPGSLKTHPFSNFEMEKNEGT
jgi:hypothetical protein